MTAHTPLRADRIISVARRRFRLVFGLLVGLVLTGVVGAPSAFAHTELDSSDPADGGTVEQAPTSISLVFADTVRGADPVFTLTVAGADPVQAPAVIDGSTVTADLSGVTLPAVTYPASWQVGYRLVASDGDAFRGHITFTVTGGPVTGADPEPTAPVTRIPTATATAPASTETSAGGFGVGATPSSSSVSTTASTTSSSTSTATPAATTTAAPDDQGNSGLWWPVGTAVVVLVVGGGFWYARSRRTARSAD